jgi:hypothetical protein
MSEVPLYHELVSLDGYSIRNNPCAVAPHENSRAPFLPSRFFFLFLLPSSLELSGVIQKSMSLEYKPASKTLHIYVKYVRLSTIDPKPYRGTSLIRNSPPLETCSSICLGPYGGHRVKGGFL